MRRTRTRSSGFRNAVPFEGISAEAVNVLGLIRAQTRQGRLITPRDRSDRAAGLAVASLVGLLLLEAEELHFVPCCDLFTETFDTFVA